MNSSWRNYVTNGLLIALLAAAVIFNKHWLLPLRQFFAGGEATGEAESNDAPADVNQVLHLSGTARRNINLRVEQLKLRDFERTVRIPATVVERPGLSQTTVSAPLTGIVTRTMIIEGQAVQPGQLLFELRLTHEDLVTSQRDYLRSLQELDVVEEEIVRLSKITDVIEGKRLLEKKYEKRKLEAALHAQQQGLLLHGLSQQQIDGIKKQRLLLQRLTVAAPPYVKDQHSHDFEHLYHAQSINVRRGQQVAAGDALAVLADHCELYIEGNAFEQDAERLTQAAQAKAAVRLTSFDGFTAAPNLRLQIMYLADRVESESRALHFYLNLPNRIVSDSKEGDRRFVTWRYRPGQRLQVEVGVERWTGKIVLPVEAVVQEGAETYLFQQDADAFKRVPVHVEYRDNRSVVIGDTKTLEHKIVAVNGAYEMNLALKNQDGGGVAPHHGHSH